MRAKPLPAEELLTQFLHFCRNHYAENSSEIRIGENAKEFPEFLITPIKPKKTATTEPETSHEII